MQKSKMSKKEARLIADEALYAVLKMGTKSALYQYVASELDLSDEELKKAAETLFTNEIFGE